MGYGTQRAADPMTIRSTHTSVIARLVHRLGEWQGADSVARATVTGQLLRMENLTCADAVRAILSVLPLDTFVDDFAGRMEVVGDPAAIPPVQAEVQAEIDAAEGRPRPMIGIERFAFYDMARKSYAVIQTGERRFYGCFMFRKGVIAPVP